jgi:hypothetical protein
MLEFLAYSDGATDPAIGSNYRIRNLWTTFLVFITGCWNIYIRCCLKTCIYFTNRTDAWHYPIKIRGILNIPIIPTKIIKVHFVTNFWLFWGNSGKKLFLKWFKPLITNFRQKLWLSLGKMKGWFKCNRLKTPTFKINGVFAPIFQVKNGIIWALSRSMSTCAALVFVWHNLDIFSVRSDRTVTIPKSEKAGYRTCIPSNLPDTMEWSITVASSDPMN